MLYRPSDLPQEDLAAFESHVTALRPRVLDAVEAVLDDLPSKTAGQFAYDLAFTPNDSLPKREQRPKLDTALLAEQVYCQHDPDGRRLDPLLEFTVAVQEYFDMLDDVVDGDVRDDREGEVVLATQLLLAPVVRRLDLLDATTYWCTETNRLLQAPLAESQADPTPDAYRETLERQAALYGSTAGIAALAADGDDAAVDRAAAIGGAVYQHRQIVLDYEQSLAGHAERWNAGVVFDDAAVLDALDERRERVFDLTASYDERRARLLRALVALDVDEWREKIEG